MTKQVAMVILAGPIKHWWDENWDTPEHWHYDSWRRMVNDALVANSSYLVYRPHEAFKGSWTERAQSVNDAALKTVDVVINLTPPGVPSLGTDSEVLYASNNGAIIIDAPPTENFDEGISELLKRLDDLKIHRNLVEQEVVLESVGYSLERTWLLDALFRNYTDHIVRLHYSHDNGHTLVQDALEPRIDFDKQMVSYFSDDLEHSIKLEKLLKAEVLGRKKKK